MRAVGTVLCFVALLGACTFGACTFGACTFGIDTAALSACNDGHCASGDAEAGLPDAATEDATATDGANDADGPDGAFVCPGGRGPTMVVTTAPTGPFCIDGTEVTNDDYRAFLAAADCPAESALAVACRGRTTWTPSQGWPPAPGLERFPVVFVDFCDAQTYCAWAGKRLCGALGGGPLATTSMSRPNDAWFTACGGGARAYPYGATYDANACNGVDLGDGSAGARAVGSLSGCAPSAAGPFDQSGNVWEWIDACDGDVDGNNRCYARGGAFNAPATELTCASQRGGLRAAADATIGIRCCAP